MLWYAKVAMAVVSRYKYQQILLTASKEVIIVLVCIIKEMIVIVQPTPRQSAMRVCKSL